MSEEKAERSRTYLQIDNSDGEPNEDALAIAKAVAEAAGLDGVIVAPIVFCDVCQLVDCVCGVRLHHAASCRMLRAMECPIAISCHEHGLDVCPTCDACDCGGKR